MNAGASRAVSGAGRARAAAAPPAPPRAPPRRRTPPPPRRERRLGALAHGLVRLAEELAALGVADDRAGDAELEQHPGGDLAGEGALGGPVDVLRVDRVAALARGRGRDARRADDGP